MGDEEDLNETELQSQEDAANRKDPQEDAANRKDPPGFRYSARGARRRASRLLRVINKQQQRRMQRLLEKRKSCAFDDNKHAQDRLICAKSNASRKGGRETDHFGALPSDSSNEIQSYLFFESLKELGQHFHTTIYTNIMINSDLTSFEWVCALLEIPFIVIRQLVTPIPCENEYNRSLVAFSFALSPIWIAVYTSTKTEF